MSGGLDVHPWLRRDDFLAWKVGLVERYDGRMRFRLGIIVRWIGEWDWGAIMWTEYAYAPYCSSLDWRVRAWRSRRDDDTPYYRKGEYGGGGRNSPPQQ